MHNWIQHGREGPGKFFVQFGPVARLIIPVCIFVYYWPFVPHFTCTKYQCYFSSLILIFCAFQFNCTDKCPDSMPYKTGKKNKETGELETVCTGNSVFSSNKGFVRHRFRLLSFAVRWLYMHTTLGGNSMVPTHPRVAKKRCLNRFWTLWFSYLLLLLK